MIKYLSCPDLHWSDAWMNVSISIFRAIIKAARENEVDFVAFPGDMFDKAIYATDKGGINEIRALMRELTAVCPAVAVAGTPSHDYPGCYGPLEAEGLRLLQPGVAYEYNRFNGSIFLFRHDNVFMQDCLLFGIPEVTKEWYQANHAEVSADRVNAECTELVHNLIRNEIAPVRMSLPNIPAIGLLHGNVSDALDRGAETDRILQASDVIIRTAVMAESGVTRWELGHIHTPWESSRISAGYAGYAGIDRNPWGKTGFVPSMGMVTIDDAQTVSVMRIPYGTPKRIKITEPLAVYDPTVAYWLDSADPDAQKPAGHEWSRVTYRDETTVTRRVDSSALVTVKTLPELGKLFDPAITDGQLAKLAEAEKSSPKLDAIERNILIADVEITGCKLFKGKTARINIKDAPNGIVQLSGANGSGKSSLAGFCTPYPCFIGKDTESGRMSAIKDFFNRKESGIKKTVYLNGQKHDHVITIRGAHTENPKTECYLTIDGVPQLEKATFDDMFKTCESLYGSLAEYMMTSFYVQPLQGKAESGLMTASMTTLRDLVQNISGINHEAEKRYALDRVNELDAEIKTDVIKIEAERSMIESVDALNAERARHTTEICIEEARIPELNELVLMAEANSARVKAEAETQNEKYRQKMALEQKISAENAKLAEANAKHTALITAVNASATIPDILAEDARVKSAYNAAVEQNAAIQKKNADADAEYQKTRTRIAELTAIIQKKNAEAEAEYQKTRMRIAEINAAIQKKTAERDSAYNAELREYTARKNDAERFAQQRASYEQRIVDIDKKCPQCGYADPAIIAQIAQIRALIDATPVFDAGVQPVKKMLDISAETAELDSLRAINPPAVDVSAETAEINALRAITPPHPVLFTMPSRGLTDADIARLTQDAHAAAGKKAEADMIQSMIIPDITARIAELTAEHDAITFKFIDTTEADNSLNYARRNLDTAKSAIANEYAAIKSIDERINKANTQTEALNARTAKIADKQTSLADWKYCADILGAAKIPAMELDAVLDAIDAEATRAVKPYRSERYMFASSTQQDGKDGTVNKFDVKVHDTETGDVRSMMQYSVGEKTFLTDAYTKALIKMRTERTKTAYNPIISDEQDSFVEIPMIPVFYEMQQAYYTDGARVLVISHSPDAGNYIQNKIEMSDVIS